MVYTSSPDAGPRWSQMNIAGQPLRAMDAREGSLRTHEMRYDALMRPVETVFVANGNAAVVMRTEYGDTTIPNPPVPYSKGRVLRVYDGAGVAEAGTRCNFDLGGLVE